MNLNDLKLLAKEINLPERSKYRKKEDLEKAIEKFQNQPRKIILRSELQNMTAIGVRNFARNNNIVGWSKDRRKKVLIDLILNQLGDTPGETEKQKQIPMRAICNQKH